MIQITDRLGNIRPPKPGERFTMKDGRLYTVDRAGSLRAVRAEESGKRLTLGKRARKARRAAEMEGMGK